MTSEKKTSPLIRSLDNRGRGFVKEEYLVIVM